MIGAPTRRPAEAREPVPDTLRGSPSATRTGRRSRRQPPTKTARHQLTDNDRRQHARARDQCDLCQPGRDARRGGHLQDRLRFRRALRSNFMRRRCPTHRKSSGRLAIATVALEKSGTRRTPVIHRLFPAFRRRIFSHAARLRRRPGRPPRRRRLAHRVFVSVTGKARYAGSRAGELAPIIFPPQSSRHRAAIVLIFHQWRGSEWRRGQRRTASRSRTLVNNPALIGDSDR